MFSSVATSLGFIADLARQSAVTGTSRLGRALWGKQRSPRNADAGKQEVIMPAVILWLLGVPLTVIVLLYLVF